MDQSRAETGHGSGTGLSERNTIVSATATKPASPSDLPDQTAMLERRAQTVLERIAGLGMRICTAESCTGGLLASLLTDLEGLGGAFDRGFVTYAEQSKTDMLGVPANLVAMHGVVSRQVALAMAEGALARSDAQIAVSITGFAGPAGKRDEAGLVHLAVIGKDGRTIVRECHFGFAERPSVRRRTVRAALEMLDEYCVLAKEAERQS